MSLLTDLVSYWKLDEASGNALDAHGSNTLTDNNTVGSATGKIGNARDFERDNNESLSVSDNADVSTGDIDFTFQLWIRLESKSNVQAIFGKWNSGTHEYLLYYNTSGDRISFAVSSDGGDVNRTDVTANNLGSPSTGTWYLIHCWHDAVNNQIGICANAGTPNTASHSTGCYSGTANFVLGSYQENSSFPYDGLIDEVGFWKRVLTSDERTSLYNGGNGLPYSSFGGAAKIGRGKTVSQKMSRLSLAG